MKLITFLILLFTFSKLSAQKVYIKYLTNSGVVKDRLEDADFIREYTEPDSGKILRIREFYKKGNIKLIGQAYVEGTNIIFTGDVMYYDTTKTKVELAKYNNGIKYNSMLFYTNGKLKKIIKYDYLLTREWEPNPISAVKHKIPNAYFELKPQTDYYSDSLGNVIIQDGIGIVNEENNYLGEVFIEKGIYKNGYKDGYWEGVSKDGTKRFKEKYRKGDLVSGKMEFNGKTYSYGELFTRPIFGLGNNHVLDAYLKKIDFKKSYTNSNKKLNEYTNATVVVNENGKVEKVRPCTCGEKTYEWLRPKLTEALLNMPNWKPATLRGLKVKAEYTSEVSIYENAEMLKTQTP